jgi:hypothetical protein
MVLQTIKIGISLLALIMGLYLVISPPDILSSSERIVAGLILVVITFWVNELQKKLPGG